MSKKKTKCFYIKDFKQYALPQQQQQMVWTTSSIYTVRNVPNCSVCNLAIIATNIDSFICNSVDQLREFKIILGNSNVKPQIRRCKKAL